MTKVPNPPPAGVVKPDPPPAPPRRRAPWPAPPMPWPKAPPPPRRDHGTRFTHQNEPPKSAPPVRYPEVQPPETWPEPPAKNGVLMCEKYDPSGMFQCTREVNHDGWHVAHGSDDDVCERWSDAPAIDHDLLAALRSALAEGVGVEELLARVRGEGRAWTHCTDALPMEAGRYEVATVGRWLGADYLKPIHGRRIEVADWIDLEPSKDGKPTGPLFDWVNAVGDSRHLIIVYAWRPFAESPPPLRPADRDYLLNIVGVPPEWLGAEED